MTEKQFWMQLDQLGSLSVRNPIYPAISLWDRANSEDLSVLSIWHDGRPYVGILYGFEEAFPANAFVQVFTDRKKAPSSTPRVKVRFLTDYLISHNDICAGLMVHTSKQNSFLVPTNYMDMSEEEIDGNIERMKRAGLPLTGKKQLIHSTGVGAL